MGELSGKVGLVMGGSSGIGEAIAYQLAGAGASVVLSARRVKEGQAIADIIRANGGEAYFVQADVTQTDQVRTAVDLAVERFGQLDIAVNNAGIEGSVLVPTADYDEEVFDRVVETNLKGVFRCMKFQIPHLLRSKGNLINISSIAGIRGNDIMGVAYSASKHAIVGMTKTAAREYARKGLRANVICPGVIETQMSESHLFQDERIKEKIRNMHPMGRFGTVDEVADAVLWIASSKASFVTGHALVLDGGVTV